MAFAAGTTVHALASMGVPTSNQLSICAIHPDLSTYAIYINSTDALTSQQLHVVGIGRWF
jgi:hypothetical protein